MTVVHVLATAGHVDHGKSTLIRRLTGIDPDRLAEEKRRGLTIDLGFAWLTLPSGREAGIVDVPGHERFVHNMLAGAGSVDAALFVVAANEGWMPQSEEHLQILDLLGAQRGVVALTKCDVAADLGAVRNEVAAHLSGTSLSGAEIVPVSAATGSGIETLCEALDRMLAGEPEDHGRARLHVDRVFSAKGSGTVVTGTLTGGTISAGDEIVVLPSGKSARIRSIQSHKETRHVAVPVARVALNLAGIDRDQIRRGDTVVHPGRWEPATMLDVELRTVRGLDHALTSRSAFKCYIGSAEVDARISFHEAGSLRAGDSAFARLRVHAPVVAEPFDRFVLRDSGRGQTVGGGTILDAHPGPDRGSKRATELKLRAQSRREYIPTLVVEERGVVRIETLERMAGSTGKPRAATFLPSFVLSHERFGAYGRALERTLAAHHAHEPLGKGMARDEARRASGIPDRELFDELLGALPSVASEGPLLRLATHRVDLDPVKTKAILDQVRAAGMQPPALGELERAHGAPLVRALVDAGGLVQIDPAIAFAKDQLDEVKEIVSRAIAAEGPLTAARIKEILGTTRKFAIPLLEYLDRTGFTRREGDVRTLRT